MTTTQEPNAASAAKAHPPIVISGPSGAGKSTLLKRVFAVFPTLFDFSVSHTTRPPRDGEKDGQAYHFVTRGKFESLIDQGAFLEHATFNSNLYGTSFAAVSRVAAQGRTCILDIEMEGVKQLRRNPELGPAARVLFVRPPSLEVLEQRLRARGTDEEKDVVARLEQAKKEIEFAEEDVRTNGGVYDKVVTNDVLEVCWDEVRKWIAQGMEPGEER